MTAIPIMDDLLGKYWEQPRDIRNAPMDDKIVLLNPRQVAELLDYNATIPTGVYPGKCWQRVEGFCAYLAWYGLADDPKLCSINYREIMVVT